MDRRKFLPFSTAVGAGGIMLSTASSAAAAPSNRTLDEDHQLNEIQGALESLPADLRTADPATTPNYAHRLSVALGGLTVVMPTSSALRNSPAMNPAQCAIEVAGVIIEYGIPVAKVLSWIRTARRLWGGVRRIIRAIRSGAAAAQIGPEGVEVLKALLGFGDVIAACFG